jgi:hypothetical protein
MRKRSKKYNKNYEIFKSSFIVDHRDLVGSASLMYWKHFRISKNIFMHNYRYNVHICEYVSNKFMLFSLIMKNKSFIFCMLSSISLSVQKIEIYDENSEKQRKTFFILPSIINWKIMLISCCLFANAVWM